METGIGYITERDPMSLPAVTGTPFCLRLIQLALHTMSGNAGLVETPLCARSLRRFWSRGSSHPLTKNKALRCLPAGP